jgi:hypothetical protein
MADPFKVLTVKAARMVLNDFDSNSQYDNMFVLFVQQVNQLLSTVANVYISCHFLSFHRVLRDITCISSVYRNPCGQQTANKPEIFLRSQARTSIMK